MRSQERSSATSTKKSSLQNHNMKTLGEVLQLSVAYLEERAIERPRRQVEELLSSLLELDRLDLYMHFDRPLEEGELAAFREMLRRRGKGEPLDYILKKVRFFNCTLEVSSAVLIPRPETEILLDKVCKRLKREDLAGKRAWDLCCGSGCLGIGLKKALPQLEVSLSDISVEALDLARKNSVRNGVSIEVLQGDLLAPFAGRRADIVLCNPPYITEKEYLALDAEVRDFEPKGALVGGVTGLEFYARLAKDLPSHLNPRGLVFFEIGTSQKEAVLELFSAEIWKLREVEKDWAGHDRFFFLEIE